ncbi:N-acetylmuramoyl-L-alanine amidase [Ureibacillus aquaedulcis]|uniref:N-acetylmuramoyl-L-alanine amidase n=1 Tax=Ureibacillus aquaedulcis TaxID=3058421 RepID=A0ABT8GL53_9BACL|nr:N-acetylmuramoyl-L-alanine amidase [Ureibacillus sp. BA0131]MDN4492143.1 N-acetylmuramoyl-L-alanine amidase [Ureibacillus sp. BA0131]
MMVKRATGLWIILVLVCMALVPLNSASANTLSDIPDAYSKEINYLIGKNIITGYEDGEFKPNQLVTREEAATMIGKALNLNGSTPRVTNFSDVNPNSYAAGYIQSANDQKIITGYTDGTFKPKTNMTRLEMAYLLSNAFKLTDTSKVFYTDMPSGTAQSNAIAGITNAGVTNGYTDGTFKPSASISRAEFAIMLARVLNDTFKVQPPEVTGKTQYVTVDSLNVRTGPGTSYAKIGSLGFGDKITTYSKTGDWIYVKTSSTVGYVHTAYISTTVPTPAPTPSGKKIVALDAGHGAHDPGAVKNGLSEKNMTLAIALKVRDILKQSGIEVVMTRSTDTYLSLDERVSVAQKSGADIFVSLHMNSATNTSASGTETYYTNAGTTSRATASKALAEFIQERLVDELGTKDRGEKTENYRVIYKNSLPAVLVEMGFISNTAEAKLINTHQTETAKAIALGIQDYFKWAEK